VVGNESFLMRKRKLWKTSGGRICNWWMGKFSQCYYKLQARILKADKRIVVSMAIMNLEWQDIEIFLNASTERNDYVSNMPVDIESFFNPSIGTSFILTNIIPNLEEGYVLAKINELPGPRWASRTIVCNGNRFCCK